MIKVESMQTFKTIGFFLLPRLEVDVPAFERLRHSPPSVPKKTALEVLAPYIAANYHLMPKPAFCLGIFLRVIPLTKSPTQCGGEFPTGAKGNGHEDISSTKVPSDPSPTHCWSNNWKSKSWPEPRLILWFVKMVSKWTKYMVCSIEVWATKKKTVLLSIELNPGCLNRDLYTGLWNNPYITG